MKLYDENGKVVLGNVDLLESFLERLRGLMFRKEIPSDYGVIISPCNSIHTFFMKFDIGVVYLDKDNIVIRGPDVMKRGKVGPIVMDGSKVLEYDHSKTALDLKVGERVFWG
jgi:uncharacterized protein